MTALITQPPMFTARGEDMDTLTLVQLMSSLSRNRYLIRLIDEVGSGPVVLGAVEIKGGMVLRAYVDTITGREAVYALLSLRPTRLEAFHLPDAAAGEPLGTVEALLLEGAVVQDELASIREAAPAIGAAAPALAVTPDVPAGQCPFGFGEPQTVVVDPARQRAPAVMAKSAAGRAYVVAAPEPEPEVRPGWAGAWQALRAWWARVWRL